MTSVKPRPFRVIVTGSRDWQSENTVRRVMQSLMYALPPGERLTVVHGACPTGADAMADRWVALQSRDSYLRSVTLTEPERHPADWKTHGRAAGPIRNRYMVNLGADLCIAFIRDNSRGATGCAAMAEAAGIPVWRYAEWSETWPGRETE